MGRSPRRRRFVLLALVLALALSRCSHQEPSAPPLETNDHDAAIEEAENTCISMMLLGCMGFIMATFYLVNWPDDDIQQISWEVISSTTSVFGALLLFQSCNRIWEYYFLGGISIWQRVAMNMLHMLLWFALLQLVLAYYSGALGEHRLPSERRESLSRAESCECQQLRSLQNIKLNTHAWSILLGHVTGFAAVNAWSTLQQAVPSALRFAVPAAAFAGISGIYKVTEHWRFQKTMADGEEDEFEVIWGEHVAETEDEVISLSISFLVSQLLRLCITGELPQASGEDPEENQWHSNGSCALLFMVGLVLGSAEMARLAHSRTGMFGRAVSEESTSHDRSVHWLPKISAMSFAWCLHISVDWWIASNLHLDASIKAVVSALFSTCFAFLLIFGLDKLADMQDDVEARTCATWSCRSKPTPEKSLKMGL
ncbi:unnamed protein product [Effrenium voratum]|nr:unnamed protein product [Effrenium voratum]